MKLRNGFESFMLATMTFPRLQPVVKEFTSDWQVGSDK